MRITVRRSIRIICFFFFHVRQTLKYLSIPTFFRRCSRVSGNLLHSNETANRISFQSIVHTMGPGLDSFSRGAPTPNLRKKLFICANANELIFSQYRSSYRRLPVAPSCLHDRNESELLKYDRTFLRHDFVSRQKQWVLRAVKNLQGSLDISLLELCTGLEDWEKLSAQKNKKKFCCFLYDKIRLLLLGLTVRSQDN